MLKKIFFFLLFLLYAICAPMAGENTSTVSMDQVCEDLQFDVTCGQVQENWDTHDGWLGDGDSFVKISFSADDCLRIEDSLLSAGSWKPLPLSENLQTCVSGYQPLFRNENDEPLVPPIEKGYYYFEDRHSESTDPSDDTALHLRASRNFTLALLDTDTCTLYYLRYDS